MEPGDDVPRLFRCLGKIDQVEVLVRDHSLVGQELKINHAAPILFAEQNDRNRLHTLCLPKRQSIEQFVQCPKATRKHDERFRPEKKVHLAQREVMKLEAEFRSDVRVRHLFSGKRNVQTNGLQTYELEDLTRQKLEGVITTNDFAFPEKVPFIR